MTVCIGRRKMNHQFIKSWDELKGYFVAIRADKEKLKYGVMMSTSTRREAMTSQDQGKMLLNGNITQISFVNMGGGVYRAYIEDP